MQGFGQAGWEFWLERLLPLHAQVMNQLQSLLLCMAGWISRHQQSVIEYLQEEVRVLREQLGRTPRFNDDQRRRPAAKARKIGPDRLKTFATLVSPHTLLKWHRRLVARKYDGTGRRTPGRPPTPGAVRELILKMARENLGVAKNPSLGGAVDFSPRAARFLTEVPFAFVGPPYARPRPSISPGIDAGKPGSAPSTGRAAAPSPQAQAQQFGSVPLGAAPAILAHVAPVAGAGSASDRCRLAPPGFSLALALEISDRRREPLPGPGTGYPHPPNVVQQSNLGQQAHPVRTGQTRHHRVRFHRPQVPPQASRLPPRSDLEELPSEPGQGVGFSGLLYRPHSHLPGALRVPRFGPPTLQGAAFQWDRFTLGRLDRAATHRGAGKLFCVLSPPAHSLGFWTKMRPSPGGFNCRRRVTSSCSRQLVAGMITTNAGPPEIAGGRAPAPSGPVQEHQRREIPGKTMLASWPALSPVAQPGRSSDSEQIGSTARFILNLAFQPRACEASMTNDHYSILNSQ